MAPSWGNHEESCLVRIERPEIHFYLLKKAKGKT